MTNWQRVSLSEIVQLTPSNVDKHSKPREQEVLLCNYLDVYNNAFIHSALDFLRATATSNEISRCSLLKGDVVITKDSERHDDIGVPAYVGEDISDLVCGYHLAILRPNSSVLDGRYLYYAISLRDTQCQFHALCNGVTRFLLRKSDIGLVEIPLPALSEQHTIAHILGTLDDKIDFNRRMNKTLEAMARALFKSWFVDFEPVRAKMARTDPGLPPRLAALFPDNTTDTDIGQIPEGWTIKPLGELVRLNYGKSLRQDKRVPGKFPVFGSGGRYSSHVKPLVERPTVVVGRKGTVGSVFWAPHGCWPIDTAYFVTSQLPMTFAYRLLQHLPLASMNTDAAVPGLNRSNAYSLRVPFPGVEQVAEFAKVADLLQARIDANETHICSLAETRDALLSKLVSGEFRVRQA